MGKSIELLKQNNIAAPPIAAPRNLKECARLLQIIGQEQSVLKLKDLQNFWLSIMADKNASHKDRLQASRLYAESIGAFDKDRKQKGINGANIRWRSTPIDTEIIDAETLQD